MTETNTLTATHNETSTGPKRWYAYSGNGVMAFFTSSHEMNDTTACKKFKQLLPKVNPSQYTITNNGDIAIYKPERTLENLLKQEHQGDGEYINDWAAKIAARDSFIEDNPNTWYAYDKTGIIASFPHDRTLDHEQVSKKFQELLPNTPPKSFSIGETGDRDAFNAEIQEFFFDKTPSQ